MERREIHLPEDFDLKNKIPIDSMSQECPHLVHRLRFTAVPTQVGRAKEVPWGIILKNIDPTIESSSHMTSYFPAINSIILLDFNI